MTEGYVDEQVLGSPLYYWRRRRRVHYAEDPPAQKKRNKQRDPAAFCQIVQPAEKIAGLENVVQFIGRADQTVYAHATPSAAHPVNYSTF